MPSASPSPGAPTLVLVPTRPELEILTEQGWLRGANALVQLAGFGPVAAAARCATWIERLAPRRVVLVGLCGTLDEDVLPVGSATSFARVRLDGVGAGRGAQALGPAEMGLAQWHDPEVHDELALVALEPAHAGTLLTVCAASGDPDHAAERRARHAGALAEEMEGFGVALACHVTGTPLTIVRGAGNVCGDRDHAAWRFHEGLDAAGRLLRAALDAGRAGAGR